MKVNKMLPLQFYYSCKNNISPPSIQIHPTINYLLYKNVKLRIIALTVQALCLFHPSCQITSQILDGQYVGTCLNHATSFPKQEKVHVKQDIMHVLQQSKAIFLKQKSLNSILTGLFLFSRKLAFTPLSPKGSPFDK